MADETEITGSELPDDLEQAGPKKPPSSEPPSQRPKRDYPFAAERHLADVTAQRDRLESTREDQAALIVEQSNRLVMLTAENARLQEQNKSLTVSLESERLQRGIIGIVATVMAAIGSGLVGVFTGWLRWFMGSLLLIGCSYMFYNSLVNLSAEVRQHGIWGTMKRLWLGRES